MTSRERVLAALRREPVDRVPWIEGITDNGIASAVCGERIYMDWSVAPDGFPKQDGGEMAEQQKKVNRVLGKDNINFCCFAPIFADKRPKKEDNRTIMVGDGMIRSRQDYDQIFKLPPAEDRTFVGNVRKFIEHKDEYCACACVRLGIGATILSMGMEGFSYALADDPQLILEIHQQYLEWTKRVVPVLEDVGFDVIWAFDDIAYNSGTFFRPDFYSEHILPRQQELTSTFSLPLITHSDGNMTPVLHEWVKLGQSAIHPIQPDVMDIHAVKREYGDRVAILGNIAMDHLAHSTPPEIESEVRDLIRTVGEGGGHLISSSNSLTDNMKPENVLAMSKAIKESRQ